MEIPINFTYRSFALIAALASPVAMSAPADQYFGKQKISALGIRNKVDELAMRYHERSITDEDLVHDASIAESAAYDWQHKFPRDPWLPKTLFHLEQLYQAVQSTNARTHATGLARFVAKAYPKSHEAHLLRVRLAQGFGPLQPETPTHATPNPYTHDASPSASPASDASPDAASPAPVASPTAPQASGSATSPPVPAAPSAAPSVRPS